MHNPELDLCRPAVWLRVSTALVKMVSGRSINHQLVFPTAISATFRKLPFEENDGFGGIIKDSDTKVKNNTEIKTGAETATAFVFDAGTSLADVVDAINAIGTTSADLVAILEALRAAGALRAQMIII